MVALMSDELNEREKMLRGEFYDANNPALLADRARIRDLCLDLNQTRESEATRRRELCCQIFGEGGDTVVLQPPFFCDYGANIRLGEKVFFNFNCVVLDVCPVTIGSFTQMGSGVQILTPLHPMDAAMRRITEFGAPISIGEDVWIGSGALILPGVTIGDRTVIGAGSVVTRSIPSDVFAAGNPCRVIKPLDNSRV